MVYVFTKNEHDQTKPRMVKWQYLKRFGTFMLRLVGAHPSPPWPSFYIAFLGILFLWLSRKNCRPGPTRPTRSYASANTFFHMQNCTSKVSPWTTLPICYASNVGWIEPPCWTKAVSEPRWPFTYLKKAAIQLKLTGWIYYWHLAFLRAHLFSCGYNITFGGFPYKGISVGY